MYAKKSDLSYKLCRWGLGAVFIYAGSIKLMEPQVFAVLIDAYGVLPVGLLMPVAIALPALEVIAGIGLIFDIKGSLSIIAGLLVTFIGILAYGVDMGLDIDCGCFGPEDPEAEAFHGLRGALYRDLVMLTGVIFMFSWRRYHDITPMKLSTLIKTVRKNRRTEDAYV
ncbi:related to methylamine utilization protein [Olavius algarvensis associated proteobacterium Delta 3]|nr:related to methylamine utilization protein [Olavius algarvensis associated proteobacterium Delta 3]